MADYSDCLKMAGAEVLAYETFGSYQGDWLAKVRFEGKEGFIKGSYGSCSGCDYLQAEMPSGHDEGHDDEYVWELDEAVKRPGCAKCQRMVSVAVAIGKDYLDQIIDPARMIAKVSENIEWDMSAKELVRWVMDRVED